MRSVVAALGRFFDVRPGEGRAVVVTFSYIALAVASFLLAKPIRNGLFLSQYGAYKLVYVYVAVPIALSLAVPIYTRVSARVGPRIVFTASAALLRLERPDVLVPVPLPRVAGLPAIFYVWVNCYGIIAPVQAWTFATMVFDARQARRLFGLIGSGASLGAIAGGLLARSWPARVGTINLLLVLAALIVLAAVMVNIGWSARRRDTVDASGSRPSTLRDALAIIRGSNYLRLLAGMVFVVAIATQWTQFQFSLIGRGAPGADPDRLTRFFGSFNFWLGTVAFLIQLLLTGPALRRFGVTFTILILPICLGFGSVLTAGCPDPVRRHPDQRLRPVASLLGRQGDLRAALSAAADTSKPASRASSTCSSIGSATASVAAAGLATQGFSFYLLTLPGIGLGVRGLAAVTTVLIAIWIALALGCGAATCRPSPRRFISTASISSGPRPGSTVRPPILVGTLEAGDPDAILYALKAFESSIVTRPTRPCARCWCTPPPSTAARGCHSHRERRSLDAAAGEGLLKDPDLEVRTEALLYLAYHGGIDPLARIQELGEFSDFSIRAGMIAFLSQPGRMQNLDAARVMLGTMVYEPRPAGARRGSKQRRCSATCPTSSGPSWRTCSAMPIPRSSAARSTRWPRCGGATWLAWPWPIWPTRSCATMPDARSSRSDRPCCRRSRPRFGRRRMSLEVRRELPAIIAASARRGAADPDRDLLQQDVQLRFRVIAALNRLSSCTRTSSSIARRSRRC